MRCIEAETTFADSLRTMASRTLLACTTGPMTSLPLFHQSQPAKKKKKKKKRGSSKKPPKSALFFMGGTTHPPFLTEVFPRNPPPRPRAGLSELSSRSLRTAGAAEAPGALWPASGLARAKGVEWSVLKASLSGIGFQDLDVRGSMENAPLGAQIQNHQPKQVAVDRQNETPPLNHWDSAKTGYPPWRFDLLQVIKVWICDKTQL